MEREREQREGTAGGEETGRTWCAPKQGEVYGSPPRQDTPHTPRRLDIEGGGGWLIRHRGPHTSETCGWPQGTPTPTHPAGQCIDRREERVGDLAVLIPRRGGDFGPIFLDVAETAESTDRDTLEGRAWAQYREVGGR